jgi:MscS family membrane protein
MAVVARNPFAPRQRSGQHQFRSKGAVWNLPRRWRGALAAVMTACVLILGSLLQAAPSLAKAAGDQASAKQTVSKQAVAKQAVAKQAVAKQAPALDPISRPGYGTGGVIALQKQPFYADLLATSKAWDDTPITDVLGESPKETILNFYVVMAKVSQEQDRLVASASDQPGWFWPRADRQAIQTINQFWDLAIQSLDLSLIPESIQDDMGHEASLKLKQILDYQFNNSKAPLDLPDPQDIKVLNEVRLHAEGTWTLPDTSIELSDHVKGQASNLNYYFSKDSIPEILRIFEQLGAKVNTDQDLASPNFYEKYSLTPGGLVPPLWYLKIPAWLRDGLLEQSLFDQTLFQIAATVLVVAVYGLVLAKILMAVHRSYGASSKAPLPRQAQTIICATSWKRVLLLLLTLPLTSLLGNLITEAINITGMPLFVITEILYVVFFALALASVFLLFESLGHSISIWLAILRGRHSDLHLRRTSNLVMPISRMLAALAAMGLLYQLLIKVGLPPSTVLAFSAVPGLAIGLGASKLLGNLFAGLSIQSDRPLRVGEFCRVGDNLGFVSKIGLRSVELETLESRISIPNSIVDEATIINYSKRSANPADLPRQAIDLHIGIDAALSPEQMDDLLFFGKAYLDALPELGNTLVSFENGESDDLLLACHGEVELSDWPTYLSIRDRLLLRLHQIIDQVIRSRVVVGVSYDCTDEQLSLIPLLIQALIDREPMASFRSCRLLAISAFSYDYVFDYRSNQSNFAAFLDELDRINRGVIQAFAAHKIDIPFPTNLAIHKALH